MTDWIDKNSDPLDIFQAWYKAALKETVFEPTKMVLATTGLDGWPSSRTVLLKNADGRGLCFYTNYHSQKGQELLANPKAALLFHWEKPEHRQVRIRGTVEKMTYEESNAYFQTRNRGSQIGAWASHQSSEIENRDQLIESVKEIEEKFKGKEIPCPEFWGGFRLSPQSYEFWQAGEDRLHDRMIFQKTSESWKAHRRAP